MLLLASCKTTYNTSSFKSTEVPAAPDYSNSKYWAVLPGQYPKSLREIALDDADKNTDVFFVYPTLLTDKRILVERRCESNRSSQRCH